MSCKFDYHQIGDLFLPIIPISIKVKAVSDGLKYGVLLIRVLLTLFCFHKRQIVWGFIF